MSKSVERQIDKIYKEVFKKVYNRRTIRRLISRNKGDVTKAVFALTNSRSYERFAKKFAKQLAKKGLAKERGVWRKFYQAAKSSSHGVLAKTYTEYQEQQLNKAVLHNFNMIKSIPAEVLKLSSQKYLKTLQAQVRKGEVGRGTFEKELRSKGATNARMIARTETAKLQTAIMENRARDLGSVAYMWLSSNDVRTRKSHKEMNGVIVFWKTDWGDKPLIDKMNGNAGEFPNCRCSTEPILDERDIKKSSYKVYDYRSHKIIRMTKHQVIASLKKGEL